MTRTPLSRSKGQGHQVALLIAALTRQAAAAVSVGTYWPCEPTATLRSALCRRGRLGGARRFGAHRGRRGRGILRRPPAYSLLILKKNSGHCRGVIPKCLQKYTQAKADKITSLALAVKSSREHLTKSRFFQSDSLEGARFTKAIEFRVKRTL